MAFFEQIGKCITDAGQNVAQQTKNFADVAQLNNAISEKEKRISQLFLSVGEYYYEKHKDDETADELDKIAEINTLYAEIIQNREKINLIKGVTKCEACGADVPLNASFCNACGTKIVRTEYAKKDDGNECLCPACHM